MYISVLNVRVADVDRAIAFYVDKLGWKKTMDVPMGDMRWVTVQPDGGQASFTLSTHSWGEDDKPVGGPSGVIFEVDDVEQTYAKLSAAGVEFVEPARQEPWGGWATFKDSEGNVHGVHSPVREPAAT
jgi:predicted enzyme related to lactoylglutathione lyase